MRHSLSDPGTKLDPFINQNGEQHNRYNYNSFIKTYSHSLATKVWRLVKNDWVVFLKGIKTICLGILNVLLITIVINLLFHIEYRSEIMDRLSSSIFDYFWHWLGHSLSLGFAW